MSPDFAEFFLFLIKHAGFIDGANTNNDYEYDTFGNMLLDRNKGITSIDYNHLNLPRRINFATGGNIIYIYNAQGVKLQKTVSYPNQTQATTRYRGGFQYDNQTLQFVHTAEGYAKHTPNPSNASAYGAFDYVYNYTDHLGNIRLSYAQDPFSQELKVMEENHYYPFGLKHSYNLNKRDIGYFDHLLAVALDPTEDTRRTRMVSNNGYQYKYNGKEWQEELGLNVTAMDFRQYDPAIGRFYGMDRLSELAYSITPYRFAYNNPVYWSDPTGLLEEGKDLGGSSGTSLGGSSGTGLVNVDIAFQSPGESMAICQSCPKTARFDPYINDPNNTYTYDEDTGSVSLDIEFEGVVVSAKPKNQSNSNNSSSWYSWLFNRNGYVLWGPNRHGDLGGHKNGIRANSINTNEIFGIGQKARSVRGSTMSWGWLERIFSALKGALDMQDRASTIKAISENSNTSTMEVQNTEDVVSPEIINVLLDTTYHHIHYKEKVVEKRTGKMPFKGTKESIPDSADLQSVPTRR